MVQGTFSPDPATLGNGAGLADHVNGGYLPGPVNATGATAGIPGTWTPAGSIPPATPASMVGIIATPNTAWTTGQYVQTALAGTAGRTYWNGTTWVQGTAALADEPETTVINA